jgi:chorismate mutase
MPTISFTYNINVNSLVDSIFSYPSLSIFEAVKQFDLSRSAFYKYRDTIFPIDEKIEYINVNSLVDSIFSSIGNIVSLYL